MINLLRLLQGYVIFEATGGFAERFLNLCKMNSIVLWNVKKEGAKVIAFTNESDFKRINIASSRAGMEIKIIKKRGLPSFVTLHKYRLGVFFGVLAVALMIFYMSTLLWRVEIVSNDGVKINNFTEVVEQLGVRIGARKSKIDIPQVQQQLLDTFPELSWVSLNIFGSKAQIEYSYARKALPIIDNKLITNVVAKKSGEIVLVDGNEGVNKVKVGENVAEGSLLISGVIVNGDGTESFVHARGKVMARTKNKHTIRSEEKTGVLVTAQTKVVYKPVFFGITFPLGKATGEVKSETTVYLNGNDEQLPLGITRVDCLILQEQDVQLSQAQKKLGCLYHAVKIKREQYGGVKLEKVGYSYSLQGDSVGISTEIVCVEDIALERKIEVE